MQEEYVDRPIVDIARQPKHTEDERQKRFDELTDWQSK